MPYYIRVLSTSSDCIPLAEIESVLERSKHPARFSAEQSPPDDWAHFEMDLGNLKQRELFFQGLVPEGARRAK